jgi:hypothetical protein
MIIAAIARPRLCSGNENGRPVSGTARFVWRVSNARETLINGPTSEVAGEMASNFLDDEANRRSIQ